MTPLMEKAFTAIAVLPEAEQDELACRLLDELASEEAFDRKLEATGDRLAGLATDALTEYRSGATDPLDPEQL